MVLDAISCHVCSELIHVQGNLAGHRYRDEILAPVMVSFFNTNRNVTLFQLTPCFTQRVCRWDIWMSSMLVYCHGRHSPQIFPQSNICGMYLIIALDIVILKTLTSWSFYVRCGRWTIYMKFRTLFGPCVDAAPLLLTQMEGTHSIERFVTLKWPLCDQWH